MASPREATGEALAFRFKPPVADANFDWIRQVNDSAARKARLGFCKTTEDVIANASYTYRSLTVPLKSIEAAEFGTQLVSPGAGVWPQLPETPPHPSTECRRIDCSTATVLDVALQLTQRGHRVAAISAASAFHCGGGFKTGGRHALEEAMCVQSTLFRCLSYAKTQAGVDPGCAYIPPDAAILSPEVEVFRGGSGQGYPFLPSPVQLAGIVSVAMPNFNSKVRDAPLSSFKDESEYVDSLRARWRAALRAACASGATDLVCPDAGCGVYKNDATAVGAALREVIHTEYWGQMKHIWLVGSPEFCDAVGIIVAADSPDSSPRRGNFGPWKMRLVRKKSRASSDGGGSNCTTPRGDNKPAEVDAGTKDAAGARDDSPADGRTLKLSASNLKRLYTKYTGGSSVQSPKSNKKFFAGHRRSASQCTDTTQGAESSYAGSAISESEFEVELRTTTENGHVNAKDTNKSLTAASVGSGGDHEGTLAESTAVHTSGPAVVKTAMDSAPSMLSEDTSLKRKESVDTSFCRELTAEDICNDEASWHDWSSADNEKLPPSSFNDRPGADFARTASGQHKAVPSASPKARPMTSLDAPDSFADAELCGGKDADRGTGDSQIGALAAPPPPCRRTRPGLALRVDQLSRRKGDTEVHYAGPGPGEVRL